ncbi:MAG: type II toxin-antitoxin system RelE/ParE family toxin [Coriobacteriales bacterium]|jgi:mRNA interferase RelE/StbE|nr:type II toxin-antitoxin system RelE/ParE family toxin [Coriobacteriales bacterium]
MGSEGFRVIVSDSAIRNLDKMDGSVRRLVVAYLEKRLEGIADPRSLGKWLVGERAGQWRYRVGDYRILAKIRDAEIVIYVFKIGHRRDVYN